MESVVAIGSTLLCVRTSDSRSTTEVPFKSQFDKHDNFGLFANPTGQMSMMNVNIPPPFPSPTA